MLQDVLPPPPRQCDCQLQDERCIVVSLIVCLSSLGLELLPVRCSSCPYYLTNGINHQPRLILLNVMAALVSNDVLTFGRKASRSFLHLKPEFFTLSSH